MFPAMKHRAVLLVASMIGALLLASALTGCSRASRQAQPDQAPEVTVTLTVAPSPAQVGAAQALVELIDASGQPIADAKVSLKGDMSHPGMRPVLAEATATAPGRYEAKFDWSMAGDWYVLVTAELPDGRIALRRFDMTVQAP